MATATKYTYSISTDFPNGKVALDRLTQEIQQSTIVTALDYINASGDDCDIWFKDVLSTDDQTTLDGIVASHSGEPLPDVAQTVAIEGARFDSDGKQVVVPTPAPKGSFTWYTSYGDKLIDPIERGGGALAKLHWDAAEVASLKTVKLQFVEGVYIHDGEINWKGSDDFSADDNFSVYIEFPATPAPVSNPGGAGNCNLVPYGAGNVIVPAAGDGAYDVDLTTAVPLPDSSGVWYVNEKTGVITVGTGIGQYDQQCSLMDFPAPNMYLVRKVAMNSPRGVFEIDAYLVEWISQHWKLCFLVDKQTVPTNAVDVIGLLMLFRWEATLNGT